MYSFKNFNYNYIGFVGYEICRKLIWKSGEGCRNTDTTIKQYIPKSNINKTSPSSTLGFGCPHISTLVISCKNISFT